MDKRKAKVAAKVALEAMQNKDNRKPRTLSLNDDGFKELKKVCAERGWTVSSVIDELMFAFLKQLESDQ